MDPLFSIDDPDDQVPPATVRRRRTAITIGCFFTVLLLGALIWFGATYSTFDGPGWLRR